MQLPRIGEIFESRYEIVDVVGRGGFAAVYRAIDTSVQREVAIKVLTPVEGEYEASMTARFLREARVLAELRDPHSITMYDFGATAAGLRYLVFEFVRGEELGELIRRLGRLEPRVVSHMLKQLLSALREAHDHGVLHRDIKPANILIFEYAGDPFRVKLLDFGIAKDTAAADHAITQEGRVVGTPRYMSPEQLFGQPASAASDLYSLGLVAFEMLAGHPAVDGGSGREILLAQVSDESIVVPPTVAPEALRSLVERMVARAPAARYQSAAEVLADLRRASADIANWVGPIFATDDDLIDTEPNAVVPPRASRADLNDPEPVASPARPRLRVALLIAGIALVVVNAGLVTFLWMRRGNDAPAPVAPSTVRPDIVRALVQQPQPASPAPDAGAREPAPVAAPPPSAADGCGKEPPFRGLGRLAGNVEVFVPPTYDAQVRHPLLLLFHRSLTDGATMLADTRFDDVAREHGFVIFSFNSEFQYPWRGPGELHDVLSDLLVGLDSFCIDRTRLWVLGEGNGGGFGEQLACAVPISALAVTGYGEHVGQKVCVPPTPTPKLRLYGKLDRHVPPAGGVSCVPMGGPHMSAAEIEDRWKEHHACTGGPRRWGSFDGGACRTWTCSAAPFVVCAADGGHYWPTAAPPTIELPTCRTLERGPGFDYRGAVWKFFTEEGRVLRDDELVDLERYR